MAGVALTALGWLWWRAWVWRAPRLFAWICFTLRGRLGTYATKLALVARLVPSGRRGRGACLRGRRGTWRHLSSLCVAVVIYVTRLALAARLVPSGRRCRRGCWRGSRGTWRHRPSL